MLTPTLLHHNAVASFNGGSVSTVAAFLTVAVPADKLGLVRVASGALGVGDGASDEHTLSDSVGTVYTKVAEVTRHIVPGSGFNSGVTVSLWRVRPAAAIPAGTLLTATFSAAGSAGCLSMDTYDTIDPLNVLTVEVAIAHGTTNPAVTMTPAESNDFMWVLVGAFDGDDNLTVPLVAGWGWDREPVLNGGGNFTGMTLWGQYRIVEAQQQSWTTAVGNGRVWGMILAVFGLEAPVVATPVGGRQFLADFDTGTDGAVGASPTRRPDAVSVDYLTATSIGPVALEDTSGSLYTWKARALPGSVRVARRNAADTGWDAETELFAYSGAAITEIYNGFCFDRNGRPVVAVERPTGGAGAPEVWLRWYNPAIPGYTFVLVDPGRTPKVVLDNFPHSGIHCAPTPDVQLVYLKPGTGLVRRESRNDYSTLQVSPLPYVENIWLEAFFPTDERRLSVRYARRDRRLGTYELRHVDSLPYGDSLLQTPVFPGPVFDILWYEGEQFLYAGAPVTAPYTLRVNVVEAVDAIEVAADTADFSQATGWQEQEQEQDNSGTGYTAGNGATFTFDITTGAHSMSPRAFRARTRKQVGASTCWSPWKYFFAGHGADDIDGAQVAYDELNRIDTQEISTDDGNEILVQYLEPGSGTPVQAVFPGPSVQIAMQQIFDPGIGGGWVTPFRAWPRYQEPIAFTELDGTFAFNLVGRSFASLTSASPWVPLPLYPGRQVPLQFPPNPTQI